MGLGGSNTTADERDNTARIAEILQAEKAVKALEEGGSLAIPADGETPEIDETVYRHSNFGNGEPIMILTREPPIPVYGTDPNIPGFYITKPPEISEGDRRPFVDIDPGFIINGPEGDTPHADGRMPEFSDDDFYLGAPDGEDPAISDLVFRFNDIDPNEPVVSDLVFRVSEHDTNAPVAYLAVYPPIPVYSDVNLSEPFILPQGGDATLSDNFIFNSRHVVAADATGLENGFTVLNPEILNTNEAGTAAAPIVDSNDQPFDFSDPESGFSGDQHILRSLEGGGIPVNPEIVPSDLSDPAVRHFTTGTTFSF